MAFGLAATGAQATGGSGTDTLQNIEYLFGSNYKDVYAFIVLILVLVFRPQGLLGERVETSRDLILGFALHHFATHDDDRKRQGRLGDGDRKGLEPDDILRPAGDVRLPCRDHRRHAAVEFPLRHSL